MVHSISILGSTGSIGRQTVAVAEHLGLNVRALTTNRNIQLAEEQARRLHPAFVAVMDEAAAKELRIALADTDIAVGGGENALCEAAVISDTDAVVTAVSGAVGLRPTLAAIERDGASRWPIRRRSCARATSSCAEPRNAARRSCRWIPSTRPSFSA